MHIKKFQRSKERRSDKGKMACPPSVTIVHGSGVVYKYENAKDLAEDGDYGLLKGRPPGNVYMNGELVDDETYAEAVGHYVFDKHLRKYMKDDGKERKEMVEAVKVLVLSKSKSEEEVEEAAETLKENTTSNLLLASSDISRARSVVREPVATWLMWN